MVAEEVLMSIDVKKDALLLVMAFLFASGCGTDAPPPITDKPTKKAALKEEVNQHAFRIRLNVTNVGI